MSQLGHVLSPLLVGRDDLLELAVRRIAEVAAGQGQFLLVSGEAGIGKTRLLAAIRATAESRAFRVSQGDVVPEDRGVPAASFLDLARALQRRPEFGDLGRDILTAVRDVPGDGSPARRRVVHEVVDLIAGAVEMPTVVIFEDLHWADELSLEILAELARATRDRRLLLIGTFRSDELQPRSTLREWRSRLVTQRIAEEVRLDRLTLEETALVTTLIRGSGLPAPRDVVAAIYGRTDGVPLFIEELLGALGEAATDGRTIAEAEVPETVQDATLRRVTRLSPEAQEVARAGAVIGRRFVPEVLAGVMDLPVEALDEPIQELVDNDILDPRGVRDAYDFRHQLLRDALYGAIGARDRRRWHARAAEFGGQLEGAGDTHASVHFERAGMAAEAFRTALAAARSATRLGSHREAEELYRRAIRNMPADLPPGDAGAVHEGHGRELAAIDDNEAASAALLEARRLYAAGGQTVAAAAVLAPLIAVRHVLGDGVTVNEPLLRQGLAELERAPESEERRRARGRLLAALGYSLGLALRIPDGERSANEALALATEAGDEATRITALATLSQFLPFAGRIAEGFARGDEAVERARVGGFDDELARTWRVMGATASEVFDYDRAERNMRDGIEFSDRRELGNHLNYMRAHLGLVMWATGRWDEAMAFAEQAQADGRGGVTTQITARYVQGFVLLGRGRLAEAERRLTESLALADRMGEILRISFPMWGLAEAALLGGNPFLAVGLTEQARLTSASVGDVTLFLPCIVTGIRARLAIGEPGVAARWLDDVTAAARTIEVPAVHTAIEHAAGLVLLARGSLTRARQSLEAARDGWDRYHRVWEGTWARLDLAGCLQRMNRWAEAAAVLGEARATAETLGSEPMLERIDALSHHGRGRSADEPWHPLTVREYVVAQLIAAGRTNAELAGELSISPKTANAHVEHILAQLGAARRTEIAAWVAVVRRPGGTAPGSGPGTTSPAPGPARAVGTR
jgi:DNA-binding CsgD family transcriptional regulator